MKTKMFNVSTKATAAVLLAATIMSTAAPVVARAEEINPQVTDCAETSSVFCSSERLDEIAAMEISDPVLRAKRDRAVEADRSIFCAGLLKRYYFEKGPGKTFVLGIYFIPSPFVYEIVEKIEEEIKNGDRSYIYNGQFYASPEEDPSFNKSLNQ